MYNVCVYVYIYIYTHTHASRPPACSVSTPGRSASPGHAAEAGGPWLQGASSYQDLLQFELEAEAGGKVAGFVPIRAGFGCGGRRPLVAGCLELPSSHSKNSATEICSKGWVARRSFFDR